MTNPGTLVQKLWSYCNILLDDALSYGGCFGQSTSIERGGRSPCRYASSHWDTMKR